jgi:hypothetical protein
MVDAQTISMVFGGLSVGVAAIYYIITLRTQQKNMNLTLETRRVGLIDSIATRIVNRDGYHDYFELLRYEWKDYEDFEKKYGTENNVDASAKRYSLFNSYDTVGMMLRREMVDADDLYDMGLSGVVFIWAKYKPIIEEGRRRYLGKKYFENFEFLAEELYRIAKERDPSYVLPGTLDKYVSND